MEMGTGNENVTWNGKYKRELEIEKKNVAFLNIINLNVVDDGID